MKIATIENLKKLVAKHKKENKKIGLVTGCFDILHIGHIELFRFAKKQSDILIVGIENDETIKLSKGNNRPIHNLRQRGQTLAELSSIDYVFPVKTVYNFGSPEAELVHTKILKSLQPDFLFTNKFADRLWKEKKIQIQELGIELLVQSKKRSSSSSSILEKLSKE